MREDVLFAVVEHFHRLGHHLHPALEFVAFGVIGGLIGAFVFEPILPLCGAVIVGADRRIKRGVATRQAPVHGDHFGLGYAQIIGNALDVFGAQIALFQGTDAGFGLAQVEEQLLLRRRRAKLHQRPRTQDVFLNRGADPPHRVGREAEALFGVKFLDGLHEAHVGLRDHFGLRQAIAAIPHRYFRGEAEVRGHHLVRGVGVFLLDPTLGKHVFLLRLQHRKFADFLQVTVQTAFRCRCGQICIISHGVVPLFAGGHCGPVHLHVNTINFFTRG